MRARFAVRDYTLSPPACFTPLPSDLRHAGSCSLRRLLPLSHFAPPCPTLAYLLDDRLTYFWNTPSLLAALALWCGRIISHHPFRHTTICHRPGGGNLREFCLHAPCIRSAAASSRFCSAVQVTTASVFLLDCFGVFAFTGRMLTARAGACS